MSAWLLSEKKIIAWLKQTDSICFCVNSFLEKNIEIIACIFERLTFFGKLYFTLMLYNFLSNGSNWKCPLRCKLVYYTLNYVNL